MWFPIGIFQNPNHSGRAQRRSLIPLRWEVCHSSLTSSSAARFDIVVTMFAVGKINENTVDCPRFVASKGALRKDSTSSFNPERLMKRIHGESNKFDEEEAQQAQCKDQRRRAPFYLESPIGFTFTWNRPLCAVLFLGGGGGGVLECSDIVHRKFDQVQHKAQQQKKNIYIYIASCSLLCPVFLIIQNYVEVSFFPGQWSNPFSSCCMLRWSVQVTSDCVEWPSVRC